MLNLISFLSKIGEDVEVRGSFCFMWKGTVMSEVLSVNQVIKMCIWDYSADSEWSKCAQNGVWYNKNNATNDIL